MVILDGIQDPGNAGTIVRSAEAFGASGLIFLEGSVHVPNGKFLRATAGSIFRLPYLEYQKRPALMAQLRAANRTAIRSNRARRSTSISQADLRQPAAIVVGSEAHGVSPELLACAPRSAHPHCPGGISQCGRGLLHRPLRSRASKRSNCEPVR